MPAKLCPFGEADMSKSIQFVAWMTVLAVLLAVLAGPLTRFGIAHFRATLLLFALSSLVAGVGAVILLVNVIMTRNAGGSVGGLRLAALVGGLVVAAFFASLFAKARSVPPIHDISTDTANPPLFVDVLPLRAGAMNPPEYAGPDTAAQQAKAYPDIRTLTLPQAPAALFDRTKAAMTSFGWDIVGSDPASGRIEATETTAWFGFKDDVVVRIQPAAEGATIDIRSKSRVGISDVGANAARIRKLVEAVQAG